MEALYDGLRHFAQQLVQNGMLPDSLQYTFMLNALMAGLIIGPLLGMIGTAVVAKRMAFFSTAIGNSALTGIAIGIFINDIFSIPILFLPLKFKVILCFPPGSDET